MSRKQNDFIVQQWMRFGINYEISPDVAVFFQPQYAKNWGAGASGATVNGACGAAVCANDPFNVGQGDTLFVRQAWVMIRNAGLKNLDLKIGRQLIVFGNHRLFGHYDWANTGFSHDSDLVNYNAEKWNMTAGWARPAEGDFNNTGDPDMFPLAVPGVNGPPNPGAGFTTDASNDADFFFLRTQIKLMKGLVLEPMWVYLINGSGGNGNILQAHAPNQNRHTLGARAAYKGAFGGNLGFDLTGEGYWQTGSIGVRPGNSSRELRINAWAAAFMGGVTFKNVPTKPRLGFEFNGASGDDDAFRCNGNSDAGVAACGGNANTFENLYPTNHILMGYMDLFAWKNMIAYSGNVKLKPTDASHLEIAGWIFRKQVSGDNWYRAAQNTYFANRVVGGVNRTPSSSLGQEIDVIFTHFFKEGKVAFQLGYGHFFAGQFLEQLDAQNRTNTAAPIGREGSPLDQDWGYTQIHVNF